MGKHLSKNLFLLIMTFTLCIGVFRLHAQAGGYASSMNLVIYEIDHETGESTYWNEDLANVSVNVYENGSLVVEGARFNYSYETSSGQYVAYLIGTYYEDDYWKEEMSYLFQFEPGKQYTIELTSLPDHYVFCKLTDSKGVSDSFTVSGNRISFTFDSSIAAAMQPEYYIRIYYFNGPHTTHMWVEKDEKEATCTTEGWVEYSCFCGAAKTTIIPNTDHDWDEVSTTRSGNSCVGTEEINYVCDWCGLTKTEVVNYGEGHDWGEWYVYEKATISEPEKERRVCSRCGETEMKSVGSKLSPSISASASSLTLKRGQSTSALTVSMANGDYVKSVKSNKTNILKVKSFSSTGKIRLKAGEKTGAAKLTITLASGETKTVKVKVQSQTVTTTKITVSSKKVTLKKGNTIHLGVLVKPITSQQKITYKSSNSRVAKVNSSGTIIARKKGTAKITVKSGSKKVTVTVKVENE